VKLRIPGSVPLREDRDPKRFVEAVFDWRERLDARLAALYLQGNLIGQPFPLIASMIAGGLEPGEKFAPCDGRTIKNKKSPLNGAVIPAITSQLGGAHGMLVWYVRIID
jgi:hypothetical protein